VKNVGKKPSGEEKYIFQLDKPQITALCKLVKVAEFSGFLLCFPQKKKLDFKLILR
jgi:hypothetical protein